MWKVCLLTFPYRAVKDHPWASFVRRSVLGLVFVGLAVRGVTRPDLGTQILFVLHTTAMRMVSMVTAAS